MGIWAKLFNWLIKKYTDLLVQYFFVSGTLMAIMISWEKWRSLLWAPIHGLFGWIYVFYSIQNWLMFSFFVTLLLWYVWKTISDIMSMGSMYNKIKERLEKR